jgi:D-glycero-D-manno-heptose 1,7-bisphosphate phosphatase
MTRNLRPAAFLDRDGVLNDAVVHDGIVRSPRGADELVIAPDAATSLDRLRDAGLAIIVITNQPDIARGELAVSVLDAIHEELARVLPLDAIYCCSHDTNEGCACRKPAPGMLLTAARDHGLDLGRSWLVGDRWVDIAAGHAAGVRTVLIERPWSWQPTSSGSVPIGLEPDVRVSSLADAASAIIADDDQKS